MLHITWHPNNTTHQGNAEKNTNVCAQHHHHNSQTSPWNATEGPATLPEVFLCTNRHTRRTAKTQSTKTWLGTTDNTTHKRNPSWNRATRGQSLDRRGRQQGLISKQAITLSPDLPGSGPSLFIVMVGVRRCLALLRRLTLQKEMQHPTDDTN